MLDNEHNDALIALAAVTRYCRLACGSVEVRARIACSLTTRHGRVPLSQAVDVDAAYLQRESMPLQVMDSCIWFHGTLHCAMVCSALSCVSRESHRQMDLVFFSGHGPDLLLAMGPATLWAVSGRGPSRGPVPVRRARGVLLER